MTIRVHYYTQLDGMSVCRKCGSVENKDRTGPRWCPGVPPAISVRRRCRHCIHSEHVGMCTGRNGGTAHPCPCFRSSGSDAR